MRLKKIKEIVVGTNNQGKLREIRDLLPKKVKIYPGNKFCKIKPVENGKTFEQNSLIKAKFFSKKSKKICLADDSGLQINLLNNNPGIFSARWGGKKNDFNKAIKKVYKRLEQADENWRKKKILCNFICVLTIYWPSGKIFTSTGKVFGRISEIKKGKNGFGYDPIFIPKGKNKTFGEISPNLKQKIDHRFKAFQKIKKFF